MDSTVYKNIMLQSKVGSHVNNAMPMIMILIMIVADNAFLIRTHTLTEYALSLMTNIGSPAQLICAECYLL